MKLVLGILFLVALFHLSIYYCNLDLFTKFQTITHTNTQLSPETDLGLVETKRELEKQLNELKQYDALHTNG